MNRNAPPNRSTPARTAILVALAATIAVGVAFVAGEILLRVVPMPGLGVEPVVYDDLTGGRFYPGATLVWRDRHGRVVRRRINAFGFADAPHDSTAKPGTTRIGFFGDSYTEARQVPLEETFFRRVEKAINAGAGEAAGGGRVEVLAFGVPMRGALASYLECKRRMDALDIDAVVYVFCENDPGDHLRGFVSTDQAPFPVLSGDTLRIDDSFREKYAWKHRRVYRFAQWLKARSVLVSTLVSRMRLLRRHGVSLPGGPGKHDAHGASEIDGAGEPIHPPTDDTAHLNMHARDAHGAHGPRGEMGVITRPSNFGSDSLATVAWEIESRVVGAWAGYVRRAGREFVVLGVPRADAVSRPETASDSWAPWLRTLCDSLGVALVDPSARLIEGHRTGVEMYDNHFTREGHQAVSEAFVSWWRTTRADNRR